MKTMRKVIGKVADTCLCHRALHATVAVAYTAGWGHVVEHGMVMAVAAVVYAVMAVRG